MMMVTMTITMTTRQPWAMHQTTTHCIRIITIAITIGIMVTSSDQRHRGHHPHAAIVPMVTAREEVAMAMVLQLQLQSIIRLLVAAAHRAVTPHRGTAGSTCMHLIAREQQVTLLGLLRADVSGAQKAATRVSLWFDWQIKKAFSDVCRCHVLVMLLTMAMLALAVKCVCSDTVRAVAMSLSCCW
jgi:hypothetical protein